MQINQLFKTGTLCATLLALGLSQATAQTTATWIGPATGGEWNTAANWSTGLAPADATTNAVIGAATNVNYNLPMVATTFGFLTNNGILNINTNGFNNTGILMLRPGGSGKLYVNAGGVVNITGNLGFCSNSAVAISNGGSMVISGQLLVGSGATGGTGSGTVNSIGMMTNYGGILSAPTTSLNPGNGSVSGSSALLVINGGSNYLGNVTIKRSSAGSTGYNSLGTEGLMIYGGLVNMNTLNVGGAAGNSFLSALVAGGIVTNAGSVYINQGTSARGSRLLQTGGLFVVPDPSVVNPNPTVSGSLNVYSVTGGTNFVGGLYFGNSNSSAGTINFTNSATIYVGSQGIGYNGVATLNASLNSGGLFGSTTDWTNAASLTLAGGAFTFQAGDPTGVAHNIYSSGILKGTGSLTKTGNGTLILDAAETYSGSTLVSAGTLVVGASGSLGGTPQIILNSGTTLDVSLASGFTLGTGKTLLGFGVVTGDVAVASAATINPGTNGAPGTLTFSNSLVETGGAINHFDLSTNPNGPNNDLVVVQGDLNISGVSNIVDISGGGSSGSVYPLFRYHGNFVGSLSSLNIVGPTGILTNDTSLNQIEFIVASSLRSPTNIVWLGNATNEVWDVVTSTNWSNNGSLDFFLTGDNVTFGPAGVLNSNVNISVPVTPASVTVAAAGDYYLAGAGSINGTGGILKTNAGRLVIGNTNQFQGGVTVKGGTVSFASVADDGIASPLGQTGTILVDGGALEYSGSSDTWTRALTFGTNGSTVSVPTAGVALTLVGALGGSGSLTKTGNGTLVLSGSGNSYTNTVVNAGILTLNNAAAAGSGTITLNGGSTLAVGAVKPANTIDVACTSTFS